MLVSEYVTLDELQITEPAGQLQDVLLGSTNSIEQIEFHFSCIKLQKILFFIL